MWPILPVSPFSRSKLTLSPGRAEATCKLFYAAHDGARSGVEWRGPDVGTGMEKVPSHFVGCKSVVNAAAVFFVIGHCHRRRENSFLRPA